MKSNQKRASIFIYVLILINIALIVGYVVYNNTYILNNNISIGKNSDEIFSHILNKGNINIDSVRQYNGNGGGFTDFISCPQNITMSGTTLRQEGMTSQMRYDFGTIYCHFEYYGEEVRLYFNPETTDFTRVYFNGELREIVNDFFYGESQVGNGEIDIDESNTTEGNSGVQNPDNIFNENPNNQYLSKRVSHPLITFTLNSTKIISKFIINKKANNGTNFWNSGTIDFNGPNGTVSATVTGVRNQDVIELNFANGHFATGGGVNEIVVTADGNRTFLDIVSIGIFEWGSTGEEIWYVENEFSDPDNTFLSFDSTGIGGGDGIDDNMNSDNYRATSTGSIAYPDGYIDDDVTPKLTIFGSVVPNTIEYFNVFWNNHMTNKMIDENVFNDDLPELLAKIGDVDRGYLIFDFFNLEGNFDYDMKIIQFDRNSYKDRFTLLPTAIFETKGLNQNYGYLQINGNNLSLSPYKTGNEFEFDFLNNDYSIYLTNHSGENLAYKITGEERPDLGDINEMGRKIYINPIDDSKAGIIETVANHIIVGGEKNFIGENFLMVGSK